MIHKPLTISETNPLQGPFLLEVFLTRGKYAGDIQREWVALVSVSTAQIGLYVASQMATCYQYRLYLGPADGYLYLDWRDDGDGLFSPYWSDEPRDTSKAV